VYNFIDSFNTAERFRRGFLYTLTETDEPTFLTFSLDFDFDNIVSNDYFGFYDSPLFIDVNNIDYSAIFYLNSIGRHAEADRLREFKRLLSYTSKSQPWFFQSISGLDKLWRAATNMKNDYKGKDIELEIETLESLDLRISYMADLYRSAVYDKMYMRELVPENLRRFKVDVYVSEFRNLITLTENLAYYNKYSFKYEKYVDLGRRALDIIRAASDYFINHASFFKFSIYFSEFDFSETLPNFGKYSIGDEPKISDNKFKIKGEWFMEENSYNNYQIKTEDIFNKYLDEHESSWKKNKPMTIDGVLTSVQTLYNAAQGIGLLSPNLTINP